MACPGIPCNSPVLPPSWTFTANPSANRFCDPRLEGLSAVDASATEGGALLFLDPVTGCLNRPEAPKGIWQHDPQGCAPDFVGPLSAPEVTDVPFANPAKFHSIPVFESDCDDPVKKLVRFSPQSSPMGMPSMLNAENCNQSHYWSIMDPELLLDGREDQDGKCVSPSVLGSVMVERAIGPGITESVPYWYQFSQWQQAAVPQIIETDILDPDDGTPNIQVAGWRQETCPGGGAVQQLTGFTMAQIRRALGITDEVLTPKYPQVLWPYPAIGSSGLVYAIGAVLFSFDITALPGYLPEYNTVWLRSALVLSSRGADVRLQIVINGNLIHDDFTREYGTDEVSGGVDFTNNTYTFPMPITPGVKNVVQNWIGLSGDPGITFENSYLLSLVQWAY